MKNYFLVESAKFDTTAGLRSARVDYEVGEAGSARRLSRLSVRHPLGQLPDDLVRRGVRGARESSCKPFNPCPAYRRSPLRTVATVVRKARAARLDPVLTGVRDQPEAIIKSVLHLADQVEIADRIGHGGAILRPPGGCLGPPPPRQPAPSSSSHSNTSTPQGGYDVPFQFQSIRSLESVRSGVISLSVGDWSRRPI